MLKQVKGNYFYQIQSQIQLVIQNVLNICPFCCDHTLQSDEKVQLYKHTLSYPPPPQVYELDPSLAAIPGQASPCQVAGIAAPPSGDFADAARELDICADNC